MKYTNWLFFLFEHFPPIFQELVLFRAIRPEQNKAIWQECESSLHAQKNQFRESGEFVAPAPPV